MAVIFGPKHVNKSTFRIWQIDRSSVATHYNFGWWSFWKRVCRFWIWSDQRWNSLFHSLKKVLWKSEDKLNQVSVNVSNMSNIRTARKNIGVSTKDKVVHIIILLNWKGSELFCFTLKGNFALLMIVCLLSDWHNLFKKSSSSNIFLISLIFL